MGKFENQDATFDAGFHEEAVRFGGSSLDDTAFNLAFSSGSERFDAKFDSGKNFDVEFGSVQIIDRGGVSVTIKGTKTGAVITVTDREGSSTAEILNGPVGARGEPGPAGAPGKDGYTPVKGVDYFDGKDGLDGLPGKDGVDGRDGYIPVKGLDYFDGEAGPSGPAGKDGVSVTHSWDGSVLTVESASGVSSADLRGPIGETGPQGEPGYTPVKGVDYFDGEPGPAGAPGNDGKDGNPGIDGKPGQDGHTPVKGTDYWTESDKAEMIRDVISALPVYAGEVVSA